MIRNLFEAVSLLKAAPKNLKNFQELLDYAKNIYKDATGVFPDGIDFLTLKNAAKEVANIRDPKKVVQFPGGGKDKVNPFKERPGEGELSVTIEGETKNMTPEGIMEFLMKKGTKGTDITGDTFIGKAPKTKKTKPPVDPELKKSDDQKQLFTDFENRNKKGQLFNLSGQKGDFLTEKEFARELESNIMNFKRNSPGFNLQLIPNLKKPGAKAYNPYPDKQGDKFLTDNQRQRVLSSLEDIMKNEEYQMRFGDNFADLMEEGDTAIEFAPDLFKIDPPKKADGGRIGFGSGSVGAVGFAGNQTEQSQPGDQPMEMPRNTGFQPIFPMPQKNIPGSGGIKELRQFLQATGAPELGMGYNFPVGQSGILGVGVAPSGNVGAQLKIPLSGGRFGFKDGSKPKSRGRRNFLKLMAGLGSLPFIGPLFKGAKTVEKAATAVETVPPYFFQLVNKIRQFGTDITSPGVTTESRQRVTQYEIDGDDYVMTENLSTGKIEIEKEKIGGVKFYDEYGEMDVTDGIMSKEYMTYKPKEVDVDPKTGKKIEYPEEYEEITARPSGDDGTDFETASGLNDDTVKQIVKETGDLKGVKKYYPDVELTPREILDKRIQEIIKQRNKKAGGGVAYMLGE